MEQLNLGTEKIGKLLRKFAIPCIISMVVNALYNMVDQIFNSQSRLIISFTGNSLIINFHSDSHACRK